MRRKRKQYKHEVQVDHIVSFYETDPMGLVWHGNYLKFFESAREALFRKYNYDYRKMKDDRYMWPVVESFAKYRASVSYEEMILIRAFIIEFENRLKIGYEVYREDGVTLCCSGYTVQVSVDADTGEVNFLSPKSLFDALGEKYPC